MTRIKEHSTPSSPLWSPASWSTSDTTVIYPSSRVPEMKLGGEGGRKKRTSSRHDLIRSAYRCEKKNNKGPSCESRQDTKYHNFSIAQIIYRLFPQKYVNSFAACTLPQSLRLVYVFHSFFFLLLVG